MSQGKRVLGDCSHRGHGYLRQPNRNGACQCWLCTSHAKALEVGFTLETETATDLATYWDVIILTYANDHGVERTSRVFGVEPATVEFLLS